jgi:hypothetical protein
MEKIKKMETVEATYPTNKEVLERARSQAF